MSKDERIKVEAFLRAASSIMRDTVTSLAADLDMHPRHVSIGYTYDEKEKSFGWRVAIEKDGTRMYAFHREMLDAIEQLVDGVRRADEGEQVVDADEPSRVVH